MEKRLWWCTGCLLYGTGCTRRLAKGPLRGCMQAINARSPQRLMGSRGQALPFVTSHPWHCCFREGADGPHRRAELLWLPAQLILGTSVCLWLLAVTAQLALLSMVARVSAGPPVWLHVSLLALLSGCSCVLRLASRLALLHVWHCGP